MLQDVAYGVTNIKFDSGEQKEIAHAILTAKFSHPIAFYQQLCLETNYEPLSVSSLWRIVHAIKPSQQKSFSGLDDITAAAMNGFSFLQHIAQK